MDMAVSKIKFTTVYSFVCFRPFAFNMWDVLEIFVDMTSLAGSIIQIFKYYGICKGGFSFLKLKKKNKLNFLSWLSYSKSQKSKWMSLMYNFFYILGNKERDKSQSMYKNLSVFIQLLPFLETKMSS